MSDFIRREEVLKKLNYEMKHGAVYDKSGLYTACNIIKNIQSEEPEIIPIEEVSDQLGCATLQSAFYWFGFLKTLDLLGFAIVRKETR